MIFRLIIAVSSVVEMNIQTIEISYLLLHIEVYDNQYAAVSSSPLKLACDKQFARNSDLFLGHKHILFCHKITKRWIITLQLSYFQTGNFAYICFIRN